MPDPTLEDDSLISQEDIDRLLDSSPVEGSAAPLSSGDSPEDDMELISQEDIDQLMNSTALPAVEATESEPDTADFPAVEATEAVPDATNLPGDFGELSQADIDSLMASPAKENFVPAVEDDDEEFEMISQEDINKLMGGQDVAVEGDGDSHETREQDSLAEEPEMVEPVLVSDDQDRGEPDLDVIDESEAMDIQDNLVDQETIDELIRNFDADANADSILLEDDIKLDMDDPPGSVNPEQASVTSELPLDMEAPQDLVLGETEEFSAPDADVSLLDFEQDSDLVSQDDIDSLLIESDEDEEEDDEDDILISQDDIDTLLMAADQEDEDVLGDLMDTRLDTSLDDEEEDEDILANDDVDDLADEDQVVLEGDDEPGAGVDEKITEPISRWYRSRLVMACSSALIALGIAIPATYFLFFSGEKPRQNAVMAVVDQAPREIEIQTMDSSAQQPVEIKTSGNMILNEFVLLAPDVSKDMAYITTDVSIDYSDQRAYHEIQNNLSFYRDLIYESLNKSLVSEKRKQVTETDLLWSVEAALKKVLPGNLIARVSFKSFKVS